MHDFVNVLLFRGSRYNYNELPNSQTNLAFKELVRNTMLASKGGSVVFANPSSAATIALVDGIVREMEASKRKNLKFSTSEYLKFEIVLYDL